MQRLHSISVRVHPCRQQHSSVCICLYKLVELACISDTLRQEKSLASASWEESRLGTLDSADLPTSSLVPVLDIQQNGNGRHAGNGNGSTAASTGHQDPQQHSAAAGEHREEERRKQGEAVATVSLENDSVDEMWQAGGEAAAHDAPAATAKKAI